MQQHVSEESGVVGEPNFCRGMNKFGRWGETSPDLPARENPDSLLCWEVVKTINWVTNSQLMKF